MERHLTYGITQCCCQTTQVNAPRFKPSQIGRYSIYQPPRNGRLELTLVLVTYRDGLPVRRQSPVHGVGCPLDSDPSRTHGLLIVSQTSSPFCVEGAKKYLYDSKQWHEDCFRCTNCKNSIGTSSFIPHQGAPVCVTCYHDKYAVKCVKCNGVSRSSFLSRVRSDVTEPN